MFRASMTSWGYRGKERSETLGNRIKVLIVDDDPVNRMTVRMVLKAAAEVEVLGEAVDGQEAVAQAEILEPDVILMDLLMPVLDGVEASRRILARQRAARIIALTSLEADEKVLAAVRAGVYGYLHKSATRQEILQAVRDVHRGELVFPAVLTRKFLAASAGSLTRTEAELYTLRQEWTTLRTKLYRPPLPADLVEREDLLERLEAGRRQPLTLVAAPAGYGKSTLVSSWLETRVAASAWLSLEAADNDRTTFLRYFLAAVRTLFPTACPETAELLEAVEPPPPRVLAHSLVNGLAALEESFVLVLDDFHLVDDPAVHELVSHLVKHPPRSLHLMILTRHDPPLALASLRAGHRLTELRLADLQLDERQTAAFLANALGRTVAGGALDQLYRATEGWPAGLRLAVLALRHGSDLEELVRGFSDDAREVQDYLVEEVLAQQPPRIRECLAKIAILGRFCAPLCEAVCAPEDGDEPAVSFDCLLEGAGLLSIPLDNRHEWYRFHHLFRQLLKHRLEAGTNREERAALHLRASAWLAGRGLVAEAIRHALDGGDAEAAVRLVGERVDEAMNRQEWYLLACWLKMFPAEVVATQPLLLLLQALSWFHRYHYPEGWKSLDRAAPLVAALPAESDAGRKLRCILELGRCHQLYMTGDAQQAVGCGERALALMPPHAEDLHGNVVGFLALSLWGRGDTDRAEQLLYEALVDPSARRGPVQSRALTVLSILHWMAGDLGGVADVARRLLKLGEELGSRDTREWASYYLGIVQYQRGDLEAAAEHLTVATGRPFRTFTVLRFHATAALAFCRRAQGREDEARELAESFAAQMVEAGNAFGLAAVRAFQAELALGRGSTAEALAWARKLIRKGTRETAEPEPILPMWMAYAPQFTLARVWIAEGQRCVGPPPAGRSLRRAEELLDRLHDFGSHTHNTPCRIEVLALRALLHQARSDEKAAAAALAEAVALAQPGGFVRLFVDLGPGLVKLLLRLELDAEGSRFVGRILKAFRGAEPEEASRPAAASPRSAPAGKTLADPSGSLPEPLTRRELEVLALLVERMSYKEIAGELGVSVGTVKRHVHNVYEKLSVSGRRELVAKATELAVLKPPTPGRS